MMLVFLHMHKAGGSAVVAAAHRSGLKLPATHQNANLIDAHGGPIYFGDKSKSALKDIFNQQIDSGTTFMAMEWDFPNIDNLPDDLGLRLFTVLRDPLARAVSNYRMDKLNGWVSKRSTFPSYMNNHGLYRSANYYVKKLNNIGSREQVRPEHLRSALNALNQFDLVCVLEHRSMSSNLATLGIGFDPSHYVNDLQSTPLFGDSNRALLAIDPVDAAAFVRRNAADYALYHRYAKITQFNIV
ncbi:hypothetical protein [Lichenihabitans psoromatis]|uniref:hypothetical protein n=1 Tax=Lichenihabitans psoromatis TaxID=2528642 RepID=UPI0010385D17|nr:hypothetical protein [Lichenihabitans psoromatis]